MPQYETLTDDDLRELHAQRVRDLEAEHYRHRLRLAEAVDPNEAAALARIVNDLKRRIDLHVGGEASAAGVGEADGTRLSLAPTDGDARQDKRE